MNRSYRKKKTKKQKRKTKLKDPFILLNLLAKATEIYLEDSNTELVQLPQKEGRIMRFKRYSELNNPD